MSLRSAGTATVVSYEGASAKTVFQSFLTLTTVQSSAAATSSDFSAPAV